MKLSCTCQIFICS